MKNTTQTTKIPRRNNGPIWVALMVLGIVQAVLSPTHAVVIGFETSEGYSTTGGTTFLNGNLGGQGNTPNTWSSPTVANSDKLRVVENPFTTGNPSSQVVNLFDTSRTQNDLYRIFNPSIGETFSSNSTILSFGFQFLYDDLASSAASSIRFGIGELGGGNQILRIELVSNGKLNYNDGTSYITVKNDLGTDFVSPLDEWITITGIANYGTNTYSLFINGVQQVGAAGSGDFNLDFFSTLNKTPVLNFWAMGSTGSTYAPIYLDNVVYQAIPEPSSLLFIGLAVGFYAIRRQRTNRAW